MKTNPNESAFANPGAGDIQPGSYSNGLTMRENGIEIKTEWVQVDGKNSHKEYFIK